MNRIGKIMVHRDFFSNGVAVLLEQPMMGNMRSVVTSFIVETKEKGSLIEPSFTMDNETAQQLFNGLWQEGFRPANGTGNAGHIGAIEKHLEDMRTLVFKPTKE